MSGPKDSCTDLDCIRTVEVRPYRIESYRGARECKHASGVSNFAQTPDGQRRNLTSNRYAITKRSVFIQLQHVPTAVNRDSQDTPEVRV